MNEFISRFSTQSFELMQCLRRKKKIRMRIFFYSHTLLRYWIIHSVARPGGRGGSVFPQMLLDWRHSWNAAQNVLKWHRINLGRKKKYKNTIFFLLSLLPVPKFSTVVFSFPSRLQVCETKFTFFSLYTRRRFNFPATKLEWTKLLRKRCPESKSCSFNEQLTYYRVKQRRKNRQCGQKIDRNLGKIW